MTPRKKPTTPTMPDLAQMEAVLTEIAAQTAPTISRAVSERNKMDMRRNELTRELSDFRDRRALLKAQYEAADNALMAHEVDIVEAMALFPSNVVPMEREASDVAKAV